MGAPRPARPLRRSVAARRSCASGPRPLTSSRRRRRGGGGASRVCLHKRAPAKGRERERRLVGAAPVGGWASRSSVGKRRAEGDEGGDHGMRRNPGEEVLRSFVSDVLRRGGEGGGGGKAGRRWGKMVGGGASSGARVGCESRVAA